MRRMGHRADASVEALADEAGAAAGDVHVLADEVAVHPRAEISQVEVDVLHRRIELGRVVIAQPFRVQRLLDVAGRGDEGAARLGHLLAVDGQEAVREHLGRRAVAGMLEHGRPEQGMEIEDVLADEMDQLGAVPGLQEVVAVDRDAVGRAAVDVVGEAAEVADRGIQPDVEELRAERARYREAEVGGVARDVPVGQLRVTGRAQPLQHLVRRLRLQVAGLLGVVAQESLAARVGKAEEEVLGFAPHRCRTRHGRVGVDQVGRGVGGAADLAGIAVLVLRAALRALALDVPVGQEHLAHRVEELLDRAPGDQPGRLQRAVDLLAVGAVLGRVGGVVVVEADAEGVEVALVLVPDALDQGLRGDALAFGAQHDRRAVGVVGADVVDFVALHALETHPDVGLDVFHQVAQVDAAVGIGQRGGDQDSSTGHAPKSSRAESRKLCVPRVWARIACWSNRWH